MRHWHQVNMVKINKIKTRDKAMKHLCEINISLSFKTLVTKLKQKTREVNYQHLILTAYKNAMQTEYFQ